MILGYQNSMPKIADSVFIAPQATIVGDVEIGEDSSIWFQTVVRGDINSIRIGKRTNIQDLCVVHVTRHETPRPASTMIGDGVSVGHGVILHGCTIANGSLIGMGCIVMDHATVGENSLIGAGSLVTEGTIIPAGHMAFGRPAKVIRPLTPEEVLGLQQNAAHYCKVAKNYRAAIL